MLTLVETLISYFQKYYVPELRYKRIGSRHDGGYIVADDISNKDFAISFGIGSNIDWEKDFLVSGSGIHAYDNSILEMPEKLENTEFFKEAVGPETSLSKAISRVPGKKDLFLKMDIEGAELDVLANCSKEDLLRFRQIIVEFHWITNYFTSEEYRSKFDTGMSKILNTHKPVWIHANNHSGCVQVENYLLPEVFEVLFLRKDSYNIRKAIDPFYGLVTRNNPLGPDLDLAFG